MAGLTLRWLIGKANAAARALFIFVSGLSFFLPGSIFAAPAESSHQAVLEVVIFKTNKTVSPVKVRQLAAKVTPLLAKYPGFISRTFGQGAQATNQWVDIVRWHSLAEAKYAASTIVKAKKMQQFLSVMQGYQLYHFSLLPLPSSA